MLFEITIDKTIDTITDFRLIANQIEMIWPVLNCYNLAIILADNNKEDLHDDYVWFDIERTHDSLWTSSIHFHYFPDTIHSLDFPVLKISEQISHFYECNCLCDTFDIVSNLHPHDPYWALAYVNNEWHLASTGNMQLMGPYTDGINEIEGHGRLKLLHKLDLRNAKKGIYDYATLKDGS